MKTRLKLFAFLLGAAALGGCSNDPVKESAPEVVSFEVTPAAVKSGEQVTLSWKTANATEVSITRGATAVLTETDARKVAAGTALVTVDEATTFKLVAKAPAGVAEAEASVTILAAARVARLELAEDVINAGASTTLSWQTEGAERITLTADSGSGPTPVDVTGKSPAAGSIAVAPTATTTFALTASAAGGEETKSVNLRVRPVPTISGFTVQPAQITRGQAATLTWVTANADSVRVEVGGTALDLTGKATSDSLEVTPATAGKLLYTLTATGAEGTATATATAELAVEEPLPQVLSFAANHAAVPDGVIVRLTWTTLHATSIALRDGAEALDVSGKTANDYIDLAPAIGPHSYSLVATGPGGVVESDRVEVVVHPLPLLTSFEASAKEVSATETVTIRWTAQNATAVHLKDGNLPVDLTGKDPSGDSVELLLTAGPHAFVLTVDGHAGGQATSAPLHIEAFEPPQVLRFTADKVELTHGETLILSWTTQHAHELSLTDGAAAIDLTGKDLNDSITLRPPTGTWHFQLVASNPGGVTPSELLVVEVLPAPPEFTAFSVSPVNTTVDEPVTITWAAEDTTDVLVQPYAPGMPTASVAGAPFEDISDSPTATDIGIAVNTDEDRKTWVFPNGFTFPYLGATATSATVSTNGWLGLAAPSTYTNNHFQTAAIPTSTAPNAIIAAFWDDLKSGPTGKVYAELKGSAPNRYAVIQWNKFVFTGGTGDLTFQVVMHENGDIEVRYATMTAVAQADQDRASGLKATIGFEDAGGIWGYQHARNTAGVVHTNDSFKFVQRLGGASGTVQVRFPVGTWTFGLTAVGPAGTARTASTTITTVKAPNISSFSIDRQHVGAGNDIKLTWTTSDAVSWRLELDGVDVPGFPAQASSTGFLFQPAASGTLTFHATNAAGKEITRSYPITVGAPAITEFSVDKTSLVATGDAVRLTWKTTGAQTLKLTTTTGRTLADLNDTKSGDRTKISSNSLNDAAEAGAQVYTLTAENGSGATTATVAVQATSDVTILTFVSSVPTITAGEPLKLSWTSYNATSLAITVAGADPQPTGFPYTSTATGFIKTGSFTTPALASDTIYELKLTGPNGSATRQLAVQVVPRPSFATFSATPMSVNQFEPVTLSWEARDAVKVALKTSTGRWLATNLPPTGTLVVTPVDPISYIAQATNVFGITGDSAPLAVAVNVAAPTLTASASPARILRGNSSTLTWAATGVDRVSIMPPLPERKNLGFIDISTTGSKISFSATNDGYAKITLPADFPATFFGKTYTSMTVSTDGWFSFESYTSSYYQAKEIPTAVAPKTLIAPFWDDLNTGTAADSGAYWQVVGTSPNRTLIVQWNKFALSASSAVVLTFEGMLHENGDVEFQYATLDPDGYTTPSRVTGATASIGIQNDEFGAAAKYYKHSYLLAGAVAPGDGLLMRLSLPPSGSAALSPMASTQYTLTASNSVATATQAVAVEVVAPGDITLNELMIRPAGSPGLKQWIELRNNTAKAIDLRGLTVGAGSGSHTIAAADPVLLPASGYGVLAQSADPAENGGQANVLYAYRGDPLQPNAAFSMDPALDVVALKVGTGTIDAVAYDAAAGWPVEEGRSMQADLSVKSAMANDQPSVWCASLGTGVDLGTPGAANAACYSWTAVPGSFETLVGDATATALLTSAFAYKNDVALPFAFPYFGRRFDKVNISTSGLVGFGTAFSDHYSSNTALPATAIRPDLIAPYWVSMSIATGKTVGVYAATRGTAPNRVFVLEWSNYYPSGGTGTDLAPVQLLLGEDGSIEFQYGALVGTKSFGQLQTIGLQALDGFASQSSFKSTTPVLTANSGLRLSRPQ